MALSTIPADDRVLIARTPRLMDVGGAEWSLQGLDALASLDDVSPTLVVHAAFPTQDKVDDMGLAAYQRDTDLLRREMSDALTRLSPVDVIYLSSGAATTVSEERDAPPRTVAYGMAKLDDERAFTELIRAHGGRLCTVRAFALSGPYMTKPESYALGNMIFQAARTGSVEVKAERPVRRSYMAMEDMLRIAVHSVEGLGAGESITFETAGEVVEMGDLAARVLHVMGLDPAAVIRPVFDPAAPADDYLGDAVAVRRLAAAAGVVPASLDEQIRVTAAWLRAEYHL